MDQGPRQIAICTPSTLRSSHVYFWANKQNPIGSLSPNPKLRYKVNLTIDSHRLCLLILQKAATSKEMCKNAFALLYSPETSTEAGHLKFTTRLGLHNIWSFRFEVSPQFAYLDESTEAAPIPGPSEMYHVVKMTILCGDKERRGGVGRDVLQNYNLDVQGNIQAIEHGSHKLIIWASFLAEEKAIVRTFTAFKSCIDESARTHSIFYEPKLNASNGMRWKEKPNLSCDTSRTARDTGLTPESVQWLQGELVDRVTELSLRSVDSRNTGHMLCTKQKTLERVIDLNTRILEQDYRELLTINDELSAVFTQACEHWRRSENQLQKSQGHMLGILDRRQEELGLDIQQLRKVSRFWLGLERIRDQKITQFFQGHLPEDDVVFREAAMSLGERDGARARSLTLLDDKSIISSAQQWEEVLASSGGL